jgi:hypothetical protein
MTALCRSCNAPHGGLITRRIANPDMWSLVEKGEDLSEEFPTVWGPAHRVKVRLGRCESCAVPLGLRRGLPIPHHYPQGPKCKGKSQGNGSDCSRLALPGSDFCRYHQQVTA